MGADAVQFRKDLSGEGVATTNAQADQRSRGVQTKGWLIIIRWCIISEDAESLGARKQGI